MLLFPTQTSVSLRPSEAAGSSRGQPHRWAFRSCLRGHTGRRSKTLSALSAFGYFCRRPSHFTFEIIEA